MDHGTSHPSQCPNCGARLEPAFRGAKIVACAYCESTVLIEDDAVRLAGQQGVMAAHPSLLRVGHGFSYQGERFAVAGQARFEYRHGWWDEFWTLRGGKGLWISVDEGDIAAERPVAPPEGLTPDGLAIGSRRLVDDTVFTVTEADEATCVAVRGSLPEVLGVGDRYLYWHLSGPQARLITLEYDEEGFAATEGLWIDPFEIEPDD